MLLCALCSHVFVIQEGDDSRKKDLRNVPTKQNIRALFKLKILIYRGINLISESLQKVAQDVENFPRIFYHPQYEIRFSELIN